MKIKVNSYFKKKFIHDFSGKSPAFFCENYNTKIDNKFVLNLIKFSKINNNINSRICLHRSKKENLHSMIVLINKKNKFNIHKHSTTNEIYNLIYGSLIIYLFNSKKKKIKTIKLKKRGEIFSVKKNQYHLIIPESDIAIFHENKLNEKK